MGLGGYLAGKSEQEHYTSEKARENYEVIHMPHREEAEIYEIFEPYGITQQEAKPIVEALKRNPEKWVDFMMRFELGLEKPDESRSLISAFTIGSSYFVSLPTLLLEKY